jgi:polyhydroxybutyrate depolymerase
MKDMNPMVISLLVVLLLTGCAQVSEAAAIPPSDSAAAAQVLSAAAVPVATPVPGDSERAVTVDGLRRTYLLHVPAGLAEGSPTPLVFVFHGLFADGSFARQASDFNSVADAKGFLVVYPNGSGPNTEALAFNAGQCCGLAIRQNVDEAGFVRAILSDLGTVAHIDPARIYSTGWDNGAFLTYRLACEMAGTFAAVAPVSGTWDYSPCRPEQPVSLLHLHGMKDLKIPFEGGGLIPGTSNQVFSPAREVVAKWAERNGCSDDAQAEEDGLVTRTVYAGCPAGIDVEIYALAGIPHGWPSTYAYPASEAIWNFFAAHPKP